MATLKKYDFTGKEIGEIQIEDELLDVSANSQMVKDYLVAIRNNARQWSASTKGRIEVNATGKKPHKQKGLGRARQGCLAAPQYRGGGVVFGPRPKFDQHVRINKKERRAAIRFLLAEKIKSNQLHVLQLEEIGEPRTKSAANCFKGMKLSERKLLILAENPEQEAAGTKYDNFKKSIRNLPRTKLIFVPNINGYELANSQEIVFLASAIDEMFAILGKKSGE